MHRNGSLPTVDDRNTGCWCNPSTLNENSLDPSGAGSRSRTVERHEFFEVPRFILDARRHIPNFADVHTMAGLGEFVIGDRFRFVSGGTDRIGSEFCRRALPEKNEADQVAPSRPSAPDL